MDQTTERRAIVILFNGKEPSGVAINKIVKALAEYQRANNIEISTYNKDDIKCILLNKTVEIHSDTIIREQKTEESQVVKALKEALTFLNAKYTFIQKGEIDVHDALKLHRDLMRAKSIASRGDNEAIALISAIEVVVKSAKMHSAELENIFERFGLSNATIAVLCNVYTNVQDVS